MKNLPVQEFWTIKTFDDGRVQDFIATAYKEILPYIQNFLPAPHPHREGAVCPFVPSALKNDRIFFTACSGKDTPKGHADHIDQCIKFYLFSKTKQYSNNFGALIILFPKEYEVGKLLELHFQNKEQCVRHSLMLGALYRTSQASILHNERYYPLRTPTPILVIRDMVASDLMFLDPKHYNLKKRMVFLESFIETFQSHKGPVAQKEVQEARQFYQRYKKRQRFLLGMKVGALIIILVFFMLIL